MTNSNSDTRQSLLMQVTRAGFALDDAQLFLDTHPCDPGAMAYFQQMSGAYKGSGKSLFCSVRPVNRSLKQRHCLLVLDQRSLALGRRYELMWKYEKRLQFPVNIKEPNAKMAQFIMSQYGGPNGKFS